MTSPKHERGMPEKSPGHRWSHPKSFECPISQLCMHDPVVLCDGHSYERHNIEKWIQQNNTSPVTGAPLTHKSTYPNHALRNAIEEYFQQVNGVYLHAIRKTFSNSTISCPASNIALERTVGAFMQCSLLVHADLSTESILRKIMDEAKALVGAEVASVFLLDTAQKELYSTVNSTEGEIRISVSQGIAGHVATTGMAMIIRDAYSDDRFNKSVDVKTGLKTRDIMCVPLKTKKERVIGVVQLINKTEKCVLNSDVQSQNVLEVGFASQEEVEASLAACFTEHDLQFLQVFASQAAMAIANSGLLDEPQAPTPETPATETFGECVLGCLGLRSPKKAKQSGSFFFENTREQIQERSTTELSQVDEVIEHPTESQILVSAIEQEDLQVANLLSAAYKYWQVNTLHLATLTNNKPLSTVGCYLFERLGLIDLFDLNRAKLTQFMVTIENGYSQATPYHNSAHAASCLQVMHALLEHAGLADMDALVFKRGALNGSLQRMTCLFAAAVHDFEHLGVTNDFLVKTFDKRALLYNDKHVNESHHIASSFSVLHRPECDFLEVFKSTEPASYRHMRELSIDLVLATDMVNNAKIVEAFKATQDPAADEKMQHKKGSLLLQMGIKCADLGHLTLDWDSHVTWVQLLEQEFFAQGDREIALGFQPSFLMDRSKAGPSKSQVGFFNFVVFPLFGSLHDAVPATAPMMDALKENYERYVALEAAKAQ